MCLPCTPPVGGNWPGFTVDTASLPWSYRVDWIKVEQLECTATSTWESDCYDGVDNDCDGQVDGWDAADCPGVPVSQPPPSPSPPPPDTSSCVVDSVCRSPETADNCPSDCVFDTYIVGDGVCSAGLGESCLNSPLDCPGKTDGKRKYCCGGGTACSDSRCGSKCYSAAPVCADGTCQDGIENTASHHCLADCPLQPPPPPASPPPPPNPLGCVAEGQSCPPGSSTCCPGTACSKVRGQYKCAAVVVRKK